MASKEAEAVFEAMSAEWHLADRTGWPPGEWDSEPDKISWEYAGLQCDAVRHPRLGNWCGYVKFPRSAALPHSDNFEVHGGVTFSSLGIIGFDCGHAFDLAPGLLPVLGSIAPGHVYAVTEERHTPHEIEREEVYRNLPYVKAETNRLAQQIADHLAGNSESR